MIIAEIVSLRVHQWQRHSHQSEHIFNGKIDTFGEVFFGSITKEEKQNKSIDDTNDDYELTELGTIH